MAAIAAPPLPRIEHLWAEPAFGSSLDGRLAEPETGRSGT